MRQAVEISSTPAVLEMHRNSGGCTFICHYRLVNGPVWTAWPPRLLLRCQKMCVWVTPLHCAGTFRGHSFIIKAMTSAPAERESCCVSTRHSTHARRSDVMIPHAVFLALAGGKPGLQTSAAAPVTTAPALLLRCRRQWTVTDRTDGVPLKGEGSWPWVQTSGRCCLWRDVTSVSQESLSPSTVAPSCAAKSNSQKQLCNGYAERIKKERWLSPLNNHKRMQGARRWHVAGPVGVVCGGFCHKSVVQ